MAEINKSIPIYEEFVGEEEIKRQFSSLFPQLKFQNVVETVKIQTVRKQYRYDLLGSSSPQHHLNIVFDYCRFGEDFKLVYTIGEVERIVHSNKHQQSAIEDITAFSTILGTLGIDFDKPILGKVLSCIKQLHPDHFSGLLAVGLPHPSQNYWGFIRGAQSN